MIGGCGQVFFFVLGGLTDIVSSNTFHASLLRKLYLLKGLPKITQMKRSYHNSKCPYLCMQFGDSLIANCGCPLCFNKRREEISSDGSMSRSMWQFVE